MIGNIFLLLSPISPRTTFQSLQNKKLVIKSKVAFDHNFDKCRKMKP